MMEGRREGGGNGEREEWRREKGEKERSQSKLNQDQLKKSNKR